MRDQLAVKELAPFLVVRAHSQFSFASLRSDVMRLVVCREKKQWPRSARLGLDLHREGIKQISYSVSCGAVSASSSSENYI